MPLGISFNYQSLQSLPRRDRVPPNLYSPARLRLGSPPCHATPAEPVRGRQNQQGLGRRGALYGGFEQGNVPAVQRARLTPARRTLLPRTATLLIRKQALWVGELGARAEEQAAAAQPPAPSASPQPTAPGSRWCRQGRQPSAGELLPRAVVCPAACESTALPLPSISTDQVPGSISCQSPFITFKKPRNPEQDKN